MPAAYYCTPNVERINAKLHELDVKPRKKPLKKKKTNKRKRKDEDDDDTESDEDEVDNGQLEAFDQQRHDIVAASQRVRRSPSTLWLSIRQRA